MENYANNIEFLENVNSYTLVIACLNMFFCKFVYDYLFSFGFDQKFRFFPLLSKI